ncbi:MAG: protoporphyrinogen oxidase [Actinomycetia bacterium]|nr:protoporphyrinogen oxidase [Actinomycetes bacterium]
MKKVVVIGGGITGLTAVYELQKKSREQNIPVEIILLEKKSKVGGVFTTEKVDGFLIEGGPDSFEMFKPAPLELAKELGIEDEVIGANTEMHRNYIFAKGKLHEIPKGLLGLVPQKISSLALFPLISLRGRMRAALELIMPPLKQQGGEISLGEFYKRRFGRETFEVVAEPLFGSIYACIPETISIKTCWPRGLALEKEYGSLVRGMIARKREMKKTQKKEGGEEKKKASIFRTFKNGMSELIDKLIEIIGPGVIRTGVEVGTVRVNRGDKKYSILLKNGEIIETDICIVATSPSYLTSRIIEEIDPAIADMLLRIPYASSATISLAYKKEGFNHPLDGFGFLVARMEKRRIKACSWSSTKFSNRSDENHVLIRCFVGNAQEETIVYKSDEEILKVVKEDLKDIMGITAEPIFTRIYRYPNGMVQYTLGHGERIAFMEERLRKYPGLFLVGNAYRGMGIGDCISQGRLAAKKTIEQLSGLVE